jgi:hypothetical protein
MNNKFGRDERYRGERYRDDRYRTEPYREDHYSEDRWLQSPEREFETSEPYRQPAGERWNQAARGGYGGGRYGSYGDYSGSGYRGSSYSAGWGGRDPRGPSYENQGFAPSPYVPEREPRGGHSGRGPKGYTRSDERIREDVCERLSWSDEVDATDITVRVSGAEVTLEGTVETRHMKRLAEDLAEEVSGVQDVHNTLRVTKPVLTELKEKITGESGKEHYANTGTKTSAASARNGIP